MRCGLFWFDIFVYVLMDLAKTVFIPLLLLYASTRRVQLTFEIVVVFFRGGSKSKVKMDGFSFLSRWRRRGGGAMPL